MTPSPPPETMNLGLDGGDDDTATRHPRHLCPFPDGSVVAYGGDDGLVVSLPSVEDSRENPSTKIVRRFDCAVRAVAVSSDGKRVAVGFDEGGTVVFAYDSYDKDSSEGAPPHPFLTEEKGDGLSQDDGDDAALLTQSQAGEDGGEGEGEGARMEFEGPRFDAPVRAMQFAPPAKKADNKKSKKKAQPQYYLAIATESDPGFCVIDASSSQTVLGGGRILSSLAETNHDHGGVRGLSYSTGDTLATLGMDGRLCLWSVPLASGLGGGAGTLDPDLEWDLLHRDFHKVVPQADVGEINESSPADRASAPKWSPDGAWLALPGKSDVQLRKLGGGSGGVGGAEAEMAAKKELWMTAAAGGDEGGHKDAIVALGWSPDSKFLATSGRDGRVCVWKMNQNQAAADDDAAPGTFLRELSLSASSHEGGGGETAVVTHILWTDDALRLAREDGTLLSLSASDVISTKSEKAKKKKETSKDGKAKKAAAATSAVDGDEQIEPPKKLIGRAKLAAKRKEEERKRIEAEEEEARKRREDDEKWEKKQEELGFTKNKSKDEEKKDDEEEAQEPSFWDNELPENRPEPSAEEDKDHDDDDDDDDAMEEDENEDTSAKGASQDTAATTESSESQDTAATTGPDTQPPAPIADKTSAAEKDLDEDDEDGEEAEAPVKGHRFRKKKTKASSKKAAASLSQEEESDDEDLVFDSSQPSQKADISREADDDDDDDDNKEEEVEAAAAAEGMDTHEEEKRQQPAKGKNRFVADEAEEGKDDDDDEDEVAEESKETAAAAVEGAKEKEGDKGSGVHLDDHIHDDGVDDFPVDDYDDEGHDDDDDHDHQGVRLSYPPAPKPQQPPFLPSSTPLDPSLSSRILCWNHAGVVTLRSPTSADLESGAAVEDSTVDITFSDGAFRRPVNFTDNLGFVIGSLGDDGAIFCTDVADPDAEDGDDAADEAEGVLSEQTRRAMQKDRKKKSKTNQPTGSTVYFHRFETFGNPRDKDWVVTLPDGELAVGCAAGEGWAAVATGRRYLRLYTSGGAQTSVSWLRGSPVALAGRGRFLAALYHESSPSMDGTQRIGYDLLDCSSTNTGGGCEPTLLGSGSVSAIGDGSELKWVGFDENGSLAVMDGTGMVSLLVRRGGDGTTTSGGWAWSPALDTASRTKDREAGDSFWPVSLENGKLVCVPLRGGGGSDHPDPARRPVTTTLGLRLPFAPSSAGGSDRAKVDAMEEVSVRANLALRQKKFVTDLASNSDPDAEMTPEEEDARSDYEKACAMVDKVTLKLLFALLRSGKVERSLDLSRRLHLERSFEIAIQASDRLGHARLSDRIDEVREKMFPPVVEPLQTFDEEEGGDYGDGQYSDDGGEEREEEPRRVSPATDARKRGRDSAEGGRPATTQSNKRPKMQQRHHQDEEHEENEKDEGSARAPLPPPQSPPRKSKSRNPFAKKNLSSPKRLSPCGGQGMGGTPSSPLPKLSRASTFSAQSRERSRVAKRIL